MDLTYGETAANDRATPCTFEVLIARRHLVARSLPIRQSSRLSVPDTGSVHQRVDRHHYYNSRPTRTRGLPHACSACITANSITSHQTQATDLDLATLGPGELRAFFRIEHD